MVVGLKNVLPEGEQVVGASQVVLVLKNPPVNAGDMRNTVSIPGSGRSPGEGHGNLLQYSCLENHMDRVVFQATVHGFSKSWKKMSY